MRRVGLGFLLALGMSATVIAGTKDVTARILIQCRCVTLYPAWMCEAFWWALC